MITNFVQNISYEMNDLKIIIVININIFNFSKVKGKRQVLYEKA